MTAPVRRALVLGALALGGCTANHYRVSLTPVPEGLRREVACWRGENEGVGAPFPADRLAHVARAYGRAPPESSEGRHVFQGVFAETTPDDVGGAGLISRSTTSLGSVWRYAERFRGSPDPPADLERRFRAADRLSAFFVAWFATELSGQPGWDRLKEFLEGPLRSDLKTLALQDLAMPEVRSTEAPDSDREGGFTLFLVERGYVRPAEVPSLLQDGTELIRRVVARRMGIPDTDPVPEALSFLSTGRADASLCAFSSAPLVQQFWKERAAETDDVPAPVDMASGMLGHLLAVELLDLRAFEDPDVLEVSLACGVEPVETNGEWRAAEGRVVWPEAELRDRTIRGLVRRATWASADDVAQRARFGKVLLQGSVLATYVDWRIALPAADGDRWDRALAALSPGEDLASAIAAIRLPTEQGGDLSDVGRSILGQALDAAK